MRVRWGVTCVSVSVAVLSLGPDARGQSLCYSAGASFQAGINPMSVVGTDLDGDHDADLVVANWHDVEEAPTNLVTVLMNNGDGTLAAPVNYAVGDGPRAVFATDLDGDGDADLAAANQYSDNVSVLKNNGDGTFAAAVNYPTAGGPTSVFAADRDGDG